MKTWPIVTASALVLLITAPPGVLAAPPTPAAAYAASQIDQDYYEWVLREMLFTHRGDSRGRGGAQHDLARNNIEALFVANGLVTTLEPFESGGTFYSVVGERVGAARPDEIYIVGAHYDSVHNPGADDNASGVAAVLALARLFAQWPSEATIRFIAFDLEEEGLVGSGEYALAHSSDDLRGVVVADMIAYDPYFECVVVVNSRPESAAVAVPLADALAFRGEVMPMLRGPSSSSDHYPFESLGVPAALVTEAGLNPNYHQSSDAVDTVGYIRYEHATAITRGIAAWLVDAAGVQPEPPGGDVNCDYQVGFDDVAAFVLALLEGEEAYRAAYPTCVWRSADINQDGNVDFGDINPLIDALGPCCGPAFAGKLIPEDVAADDRFGCAADIDGGLAVVGASGNDDLGPEAGAAYVFERIDGTWTQGAKLSAPDGQAGDGFGTAVAVSDGTLLVSAPSDDDQADGGGAVYVFEFVSGTWQATDKLYAPTAIAHAIFGRSLAAQGATALIATTGAVHVFERTGGLWSPVAQFEGPVTSPPVDFGCSVALDGDTAVVGAHKEPGPGPYDDNAGAAYVFARSNGVWTSGARLVAYQPSRRRYFGNRVAIDSDLIVVGADARSASSRAGAAAYVFERIGDNWEQTAQLLDTPHVWKSDVAIGGETVVVGRPPGVPLRFPVSVVLFRRTGAWWARHTLVAPCDIAANGDGFGSVLAADGEVVLIGTPDHDAAQTNAGALYVLDLNAAGIAWISLQPADQLVAEGGTAVFTVCAHGSGAIHYQWRRNGLPLAENATVHGVNAPTLTIESVTFADTGVYDVVIRNICDSAVSEPAVLTIVPELADPGTDVPRKNPLDAALP